MNREIGSEFWNVPTAEGNNGIFLDNTQWFLAGRVALRSIIHDIKEFCRSVAMPSWCCDSMVKPFVDAGIDICFYSVYWQDKLIQEMCMDCDALFLMDYFGYTSDSVDLSGYKGIVIRDVTHSIFSTTYYDADYYFGSLRKWCGVWTGGYAWTGDGHRLTVTKSDDLGYVSLREKAMWLKDKYINGYVNNEGKKAKGKEYLKIYGEADALLDSVEILPAVERDVLLAQRIDVSYMKMKHCINAKILRDAFSDNLIFEELKNMDCPMFVPIIVPDGKRDELRNYLIKQDVYCPVHWPISRYHQLSEQERFLYDNELSLVCDQRYTEDDMERMVDYIRLFLGED